MSSTVENQRNFHLDPAIVEIEKGLGELEVLLITGSAIDDGLFDRNGTGTSDIDLIAVTKAEFKNPIIEGWSELLVKEGVYQGERMFDLRPIHLRAYSQSRIKSVLTQLHDQLVGKARVVPQFWVLGQEMAEGVVINGSLPDHPFFPLYSDPPKNSRTALLKKASFLCY